MSTPVTENGNAAPILDWLASQPTGGTTDEVFELFRQIELLGASSIAPVQHHRCIELFYSRAIRVAGDMKPKLIESGLPLDRTLHSAARQLQQSLVSIAQGFLAVTRHVAEGAIRPQRRLVDTLVARGVRMLSEALEIGALAGGVHADGLWPAAMALNDAQALDATPSEPDLGGENALYAFKRLFALGSLQLERFSQNEIAWIAEYLNRVATLLHMESRPPSQPDGAWYWVNGSTADGPQSTARHSAPADSRVRFLSTAALAKRVAEHLARLEAGQQPFELNLPKVAVGVQPMALLQRLRHEWAMPIRREQPRRKAQYSVHACAGLDAIWSLLRSGEASPPRVQEWQVINESPGGFAILHVAGAVEGISAGTAVALRRDAQQPWSICVVRWVRSENPLQIELGLQVVSAGATPVTIGFRGAKERPNRMSPALVLPALPALRHHPAILAHTGTYSSRRFALVSDLDRIYVAQGRLLSLDMQTACVELFQFEIDPYPI